MDKIIRVLVVTVLLMSFCVANPARRQNKKSHGKQHVDLMLIYLLI